MTDPRNLTLTGRRGARVVPAEPVAACNTIERRCLCRTAESSPLPREFLARSNERAARRASIPNAARRSRTRGDTHANARIQDRHARLAHANRIDVHLVDLGAGIEQRGNAED